MLRDTGIMCYVMVTDHNNEDGFCGVDLGNYYEDTQGRKYLPLSKTDARRYKSIVKDAIIIVRNE